MNFDNLLSTAASIRDEKARYANTATRVGTLLYNMCLAMADTDATASAGNTIAQGLNRWLTTHDNLTTLDALNAALDAMNVDTPQGLHCFKCFGIPVLTYFGVLVKDAKRYVQIAVGAFTLNTQGTALASINDTASTRNVIVRYFNGTKWQAWQPMQPQKQTSYAGNSGNYVYSEGTSDNTRTILSSKLWIYKHGDNNLFLRFKHWGASDDTGESNYSQVMLPNAWVGSNGLMRYDVYKRLDSFNLFEQNSTATEVKIVTPIFTTGGTRALTITQATSAKAGIMTAAQATLLDSLGMYLHPDTDNLDTLEALNSILDATGPGAPRGTHLIKCFGIPLTVTLAMLNLSDQVLMMTITGSITTTDDATALATINTPGHYTTLVRYYQNGKWGKWGEK